MFDWNKALLWSALGGGSFALCSLIAQFFELRSVRVNYQKAKVYIGQQITQKKNGNYLVKTSSKQLQHINGDIQWPIVTNDILLDEYPIPQMIAQLGSKYPLIINHSSFQATYQYESIYDRPKECPGIFRTIMIGISAVLALLAEAVLTTFTLNQKGTTFISGPTIGFLKCSMKLLRDTSMVAQCYINEGKKQILLLGLSKEDIIYYYKNCQWTCFNKILILSSLLLLIYRPIKLQIKRLLNQHNLKKSKDKIPLKLLSVEVEQNLNCIICYNNCRNIVFKKCRHFVACAQCMHNKQINYIDKCPLCREYIQDQLMEVHDCEGQIAIDK